MKSLETMSFVEDDSFAILAECAGPVLEIKLKVRSDVSEEMIRRLPIRLSDTSYTSLKSSALRMASGLDYDGNPTIERSENVADIVDKYKVRLHYADDVGDKVIIASNEELGIAASQHTSTDALTIVADVMKERKLPKVPIKIRLENHEDDQGEVFRRLTPALISSSDPYADLRKETIRFSLDMENTEKVIAQDFRVSFYYKDTDGDTVLIGSNEELHEAMCQFVDKGCIKIVAAVKPARKSNRSPTHPSLDPSPFILPLSIPAFRAFTNPEELKKAVDEYISDPSPDSIICRTYGTRIGNWDVSRVKSFEGLFDSRRNSQASEFNEDLSTWDVSSGKDFTCMFCRAFKFNSDISAWNMSSAETTQAMFYMAKDFNRALSNWDVSKVKNMSGMFSLAESFRGDLSKWDVSSCTKMNYMFYKSANFESDLSDWDVSSVTDMRYMFYHAEKFGSDLGRWDVSNVTKMGHMLGGFDQSRFEIYNWDFSKVSDMSTIFAN